jgi:hypothetical protein
VTVHQDEAEQEVIAQDGASTEIEADQLSEAQPPESGPTDEQLSGAVDEQTGAGAEADGAELAAAEARETTGLSNIFIAPVEISERREQEPATRIMINTIEINE